MRLCCRRRPESDLSQVCRVARAATNHAVAHLLPSQHRWQARVMYALIRPIGLDNP